MAERKSMTGSVLSRDNRDLPMTRAQVTQVLWNRTERTRIALRTLGMFLVATFLAIFIPGLHFILVPALFIASFVLALDKLNELTRSEGGKGECPKCHQEFTIQSTKWKNRYIENCDHCHQELIVDLDPVV